MAPVVEARFQRALGQQRPESRAVDKEIALNAVTIVEHQCLNKTIVGAGVDLTDFSFNTGNARGLRHFAQVHAVFRRIEVIGVVELVFSGDSKALRFGSFQLGAVLTVLLGEPQFLCS